MSCGGWIKIQYISTSSLPDVLLTPLPTGEHEVMDQKPHAPTCLHQQRLAGKSRANSTLLKTTMTSSLWDGLFWGWWVVLGFFVLVSPIFVATPKGERVQSLINTWVSKQLRFFVRNRSDQTKSQNHGTLWAGRDLKPGWDSMIAAPQPPKLDHPNIPEEASWRMALDKPCAKLWGKIAAAPKQEQQEQHQQLLSSRLPPSIHLLLPAEEILWV